MAKKGLRLRSYLLQLFCLVGLAGCVNYGGMHGNSRPFDANTLAIHHVYKNPHIIAKPLCPAWWNRFNDSQLNQLIEVALADSPDMQIAENRVRKAWFLSRRSESNLWPSVDASGYVTRQKFPEEGLIPPPFNGRTFTIGDVAFNFNYEFDFWGKNREALAARVNEEMATRADLAEAALVISASVAATYFQLQYSIAELQIAKATLHQRQEILDIIAYRAKHNIESDIPVKSAVAGAESAKLAVEQYKQSERLARHQLAVLLGKNPFVTEIGTSPFSYSKRHVFIPVSLPAKLLAQRPDIAASRLRAEAAAHEINVAKAYFFPDINLSLLFSYQSIQLSQLFNVKNQNNAITGAVDLPIFDAGSRRANLGVRYAEYDASVNQYNQSILYALREVADQLSSLHQLNSQLTAQDEAVAAIRRNYKLTSARYNHGIVDYLDVLEVKGSLLQQRATQVDLQARHLLAVVALIKALGGNDQG